jgi:hypothetical protein
MLLLKQLQKPSEGVTPEAKALGNNHALRELICVVNARYLTLFQCILLEADQWATDEPSPVAQTKSVVQTESQQQVPSLSIPPSPPFLLNIISPKRTSVGIHNCQTLTIMSGGVVLYLINDYMGQNTPLLELSLAQRCVPHFH